MDKITEFKSELKALLSKYNATISFQCGDGSDTYGIYNPELVVEIKRDSKQLSYGYSLDKSDL